MTGTKIKLESFIESLLKALADPKYDHMACWTTDGSAVVLCFDPVEGPFLDSLLERHFRNMRVDSFERQLRHYGFKQLIDRRRKVERPGTDFIHEQLVPESMRGIAPAALMILCHSNFHRDRSQAWKLVKRRRTHKPKPSFQIQDSPVFTDLKTPLPIRSSSNIASFLPEDLFNDSEDIPSTTNSWSPKSDSFSSEERSSPDEKNQASYFRPATKAQLYAEPLQHWSPYMNFKTQQSYPLPLSMPQDYRHHLMEPCMDNPQTLLSYPQTFTRYGISPDALRV